MSKFSREQKCFLYSYYFILLHTFPIDIEHKEKSLSENELNVNLENVKPAKSQFKSGQK